MRIYSHGILPHWRQARCTYFVTFRLADSIPKPVLDELEYERGLWLRARGIDSEDKLWRQRFAQLPPNEQQIYEKFVAQLLNKSLDQCHGSCSLRDRVIGSKVAAALEHFHGSRVLTGDYVVMPNHVHVLLTPLDAIELEDTLHSIKSYTANQINQMLKKSGPLWQRESYDHIVRNWEELESYQTYISANPVKAKLSVTQYIVSHATYAEANES